MNELEKDGTVLTDSSQVGRWGAPTLDVWVVRKDFAQQHPDIVTAFARSAIEAQKAYLDHPEQWLKQPDNLSKLSRLSGVPEQQIPGLVKGNTYLTAAQQVAQLQQPVNKAIVDTAQFLKEQGKVPQAGNDYSAFVTSRFVAPWSSPEDIVMLRIAHLNASYGGQPVLQDISLRVEDNALVVVLGPSGCGKTTLLNLIAGFYRSSPAVFLWTARRFRGQAPIAAWCFSMKACCLGGMCWITSLSDYRLPVWRASRVKPLHGR